MTVYTPCIKTKDEAVSHLKSPINFNSDMETDSSVVHKNTDENKQPNKSPSMISTQITPHLKKRLMMKQSRLASYSVKNNEKMSSSIDKHKAANILHSVEQDFIQDVNVIENSATTLMNKTSKASDEDEVIEASPTQKSVASKVKQFLKLKRKIPIKHIDFGSCSSPKHRTSTQMENEQTANEMDNFNLDDTENKPPEKKIWSKRKDTSQQLNMRRKADRAKLKGWDCWECREYYKSLSLSKEELEKRRNQSSRHRHKYERPNTPEGFWDLEFPETSGTY
ncbi:uncharacterized protein [Temnothorax nylanderi]|uniref:uncharacterized protein n=1 Tax=Temnothorax nylanderi TaxID=102681 RepID=UPI003A89834D